MEKIGHWAFLLGLGLAVLVGLVPQWQANPGIIYALAILGLVVGVLNVKARETTEFLVAALVFMVASSAGALPTFGLAITSMLTGIVAFVAPAAAVVAAKVIWQLAQE